MLIRSILLLLVLCLTSVADAQTMTGASGYFSHSVHVTADDYTAPGVSTYQTSSSGGLGTGVWKSTLREAFQLAPNGLSCAESDLGFLSYVRGTSAGWYTSTRCSSIQSVCRSSTVPGQRGGALGLGDGETSGQVRINASGNYRVHFLLEFKVNKKSGGPGGLCPNYTQPTASEVSRTLTAKFATPVDPLTNVQARWNGYGWHFTGKAYNSSGYVTNVNQVVPHMTMNHTVHTYVTMTGWQYSDFLTSVGGSNGNVDVTNLNDGINKSRGVDFEVTIKESGITQL